MAALPELANGEIPTEMLDVNARRRGEQAGEEHLSPMKFLAAGSRIDHLERGQATEERRIVFEVGDEAEKAIAGRVAVDERGDRMMRAWFRMASENGGWTRGILRLLRKNSAATTM